MEIYNLFKINGKYFLFKLYLLSSLSLSFRPITCLLYVCSLESIFVAVISLVFTVDGFLRGWFLSQVHSASRRYKQIVSDLLLVFCIAMPLIVMWFGTAFNCIVRHDRHSGMAIICILSVRSIFKEILRMNIAQVFQGKSLRQIAWRQSNYIRNLKLQEEVFPKSVRRALSVYNVLYGMFFLCYGIIQINNIYVSSCTSLHPNYRPNDVKALYDGCIVKVPMWIDF